MQYKDQTARMGNYGETQGRIHELVNHCHTFPKYYKYTAIISQAIEKSHVFKALHSLFQEPTMSQAPPVKP